MPATGAPTGDQDLVNKVSLDEYTCEFSPFTTVPLLFVNFKIQNNNSVTLYDLTLNYTVEYEDSKGRVTTNGETTVNQLLMNWTKQDRAPVASLEGERRDYRVIGCKAWISGFYKEVETMKKRTVTVKMGETIRVATDCRDDYAKLQAMKPGVEKREFAARLVRSGCVSTEPVYGKKAEYSPENGWVWVDYPQTIPPNVK